MKTIKIFVHGSVEISVTGTVSLLVGKDRSLTVTLAVVSVGKEEKNLKERLITLVRDY